MIFKPIYAIPNAKIEAINGQCAELQNFDSVNRSHDGQIETDFVHLGDDEPVGLAEANLLCAVADGGAAPVLGTAVGCGSGRLDGRLDGGLGGGLDGGTEGVAGGEADPGPAEAAIEVDAEDDAGFDVGTKCWRLCITIAALFIFAVSSMS